MTWEVVYLPEAEKDIARLNSTQQRLVQKAISKVRTNPLPQQEGDYGKPLGNKGANRLSGFLKVKLRDAGLRIVYRLIRTETAMLVVVVGARADNEVYELAGKRATKHGL